MHCYCFDSRCAAVSCRSTDRSANWPVVTTATDARGTNSPARTNNSRLEHVTSRRKSVALRTQWNVWNRRFATHTNSLKNTRTHTHIHTHTFIHTQTQTHTDTQTPTLTYTHTHTNTHTHTYIHTRIHAHTNRAAHPHKPMTHIAYSPSSQIFLITPLISEFF